VVARSRKTFIKVCVSFCLVSIAVCSVAGEPLRTVLDKNVNCNLSRNMVQNEACRNPGNGETRMPHPDTKRFIFLTGSEAQERQLLECPDHKYGTEEDGLRELERRLANMKENELAFAQLCVSCQLQSVTTYAPILEVIGINPFVATSNNEPTEDTLVWPDYDHLSINRVRDICKRATGTVMWARIPLSIDEAQFMIKRAPSDAEVEWMVYASIGAGFKGIVWVGEAGPSKRIRSLQTAIERHADELGNAWQVDWGSSLDGCPISMIRSEQHLFVVLLSTAYFADIKKGKPLVFPMSPESVTARVSIAPPRPFALVSGKTLSETVLTLESKGESVVTACSFKGGGEMLVFRLVKKPGGKE